MNRLETRQRTEALRDEIEHTRAELGETVQALAARADVPARARASAHRTADRVRKAGGSRGIWVFVGAGAVAVAAMLAYARRGTALRYAGRGGAMGSYLRQGRGIGGRRRRGPMLGGGGRRWRR